MGTVNTYLKDDMNLIGSMRSISVDRISQQHIVRRETASAALALFSIFSIAIRDIYWDAFAKLHRPLKVFQKQ